MEHRHHGRRADAPAQEHHRSIAGLEDEAASGLADVEDVTYADVAAQELPPGPVRLELDAHPVLLVGDRARERVAAEERRALRSRSQPEHDELSRKRGRE